MTTDELKKEAEEGFKNIKYPTYDKDIYIQAYLAGAEPREERIAEFEKDFLQACKVREQVCKEAEQACERKDKCIAELEKENAELEDIIRKLIDNAPNTYSGTDIERQQRKMFAFQNAVNKARIFLKD